MADENEATIEACGRIVDLNKKLKENVKVYEKSIKMLAEKYKIPEKDVIKILNSEKAKEVKRGKERER